MSEERLEYLVNKMYYEYLDTIEAKELIDYIEQSKLTNQALSGCLKIDKEKIDYYVDRCEQLEKVLDEIREYIKEKEKDGTLWSVKATDGLLQILDKVGKE